MRIRISTALLVLLALILASCGSSPTKSSSPSLPHASPSTTLSTQTNSPAEGETTTGEPVWLCRPGATPDPCTANLEAASVTASGTTSQVKAGPAGNSPFDCFYVYPTVSTESGDNANLTVQPAEISAAEQQASRFSSVCRVWAPMYRQVTVAGLFTAGVSGLDVAYQSLLADWSYYLSDDNDGRPIIFIGHSQGAAMLIRLLSEQVDDNPALLKRVVVAILAGGNLQVPTGSVVGATFKHIPLCTSLKVPGCAIAYSTFGSQPPPDSLFGRPGSGVSLMSLQTTSTGQQVACVNPADVGGTSGLLSPYFRGSGAVPWVTYPDLYTAECKTAGGATWLQVTPTGIPGDTRPLVKASLGPTWGYHVDDVNLALGNLVSDVAMLESQYNS
ncbi:MAG: DUF3089 domain-containing protein [Acidimicrobiales bacterium]